MKLLHKLLFGYFIIVLIIGGFSTTFLMYNINKNSDNLSIYREREIKSFVKVIDAFLYSKESLKNLDYIQNMFVSITYELPHIKRLTLHAQNEESSQYVHIASSVLNIIGSPSHKEDINAIKTNKTTILYETSNSERYIDITHPITDLEGNVIAALGVAVSLNESDIVLKKAIESMKDDAIEMILTALFITTLLSLLIVLIITKKIIAPLIKLKNAADSISEKKEYKEIAITSNDEISQLTLSFNKMSKELNMFHNSMEEKIEAKSKELQIQLFRDALTLIPNRAALFHDMKKFKNFGLAILDISAFKDINDVYGVQIGNKVLVALSRKYEDYLKDTNLKLYRISGDEVAIVNVNAMSVDEFREKIKLIIKNVEHETFYFQDEDVEINLAIHAGIACEKELILEKANIALVKAKAEHLDLFIYENSLAQSNNQKQNIDMITKIKNSIDNYDILAFYQPIVDANQTILKYEALVRMRDYDKIISPYFFLEIAKKTKYYQYITRAMIFQAFNEFSKRDDLVSVNLCAEDLLNEETKQFIIQHLKNCKYPQRIVFEIVESEDIHEIKDALAFISKLKSFGAKLAIDDFGTGYSNFSYLLDLAPDYLKIDGSLIKNIDKDEKSYNIVKTIIHFSHDLNIKVIAEFIHSKEVFEICRELGVDEFQGYLFGEPKQELIT